MVPIATQPDSGASKAAKQPVAGTTADQREAARTSAADAAQVASADAEAAALAATTTAATALRSMQSAALSATRNKIATAEAVAAAASAGAEVAARAASTVQSEAVTSALKAAAAAVQAQETVSAELPADAAREAADLKAAAVTATVASAVIAHEQSTAAAAATVSSAVETAIATAALLSEATAAAIEGETSAAAVTVEAVAASTAATAAATGVVVESTRRAAELAARLRVVPALRDSEHRIRDMFEQARVGMMLVSLSGNDPGRVLQVNPALRDLTGRTEADLLNLHLVDLVDADERRVQVAQFRTLSAGERSDYEAVEHWRHAAGRSVWVRMSLHAVREGGGTPAYAVAQVEDITERRRSEGAQRVREERFHLAFEQARTGMMFLSLAGELRKVNQAMSRLLSYPQGTLLGSDLATFVTPTEQTDLRIEVAALATGDSTTYQAEHCFQCADGRLVWGLVNGSVAEDADGQPDFLVFQVEDVTERKAAEIQMAHQALHDDLTGLPNRLLLADHLAQACARAERAGSYVGVLFVDLDDFKDVNDSLGHVAGDEVLIEVAERLRSCLRETDTAARQGGDEFVIVCEDLNDPTEAGLVADRIDLALAAPMKAGGADVQVSASVGIATSQGSSCPDDLLRGADTAMYRAKVAGKGRYESYADAMLVGAQRKLGLAGELSNAAGRDELRLYYQPTYDLLTGAIVGVEALLRWQHPTRGLLEPADFLDVAEGRRLMVPIGDWVVATATAQASKWQHAFGVGVPDMWVNISGQQLGNQHLIGLVEQALAATGLEPSKLGLEVTERQLVGSGESVHADLVALRALGLRLAVDDFGTGFNSLAYLRRFDFDEIKIDRSFISGLGHDRTDTAVTSSVITLGQSLELVVVAEGVETEAQYNCLRDLGCDHAQGYLLQRPAPAETIDLILAEALAAGSRP